MAEQKHPARAFIDLAPLNTPLPSERVIVDLALFPEGDDEGVVVQGWMTRRFMGRTPQFFTWDPRFTYTREGVTRPACVTHLCHGFRERDNSDLPLMEAAYG